MVEFFVWVDDHLRTICGLTQETSCSQVIEALCEATRKKESHILWEVWRDFGRPINPRENVASLMRQWGPELPTVKFVLKPQEKHHILRRHIMSKKHKISIYSEEKKVPNSNPRQKVTKFLGQINTHGLFVREDRMLNREISRFLKRLACEERIITQLKNGDNNNESQRRVLLLQEQVNQRRLTLNTLVDETRDLKLRFAEANTKQVELKKEKESLAQNIKLVTLQINDLKSELDSKSISSQQKSEHIINLRNQLKSIKIQISQKSGKHSELKHPSDPLNNNNNNNNNSNSNNNNNNNNNNSNNSNSTNNNDPNNMLLDGTLNSVDYHSQYIDSSRFQIIYSPISSHAETLQQPNLTDSVSGSPNQSSPSTRTDLSTQLITSLSDHLPLVANFSPQPSQSLSSNSNSDVDDRDDVV